MSIFAVSKKIDVMVIGISSVNIGRCMGDGDQCFSSHYFNIAGGPPPQDIPEAFKKGIFSSAQLVSARVQHLAAG